MKRIDIIGQNGNDGQVYDTVAIDGVVYRHNDNGRYALYLKTKTGTWHESASVTNDELEAGSEFRRCNQGNA